MSIRDAAAMITVQDGKDRIMDDPSLTLWGKTKALESVNRAASAKPTPQPWVTPRQVAHGAVGAFLGDRVGEYLGRFMGVSEPTNNNFRRLGMGLGTVLNLGGVGYHRKNSAEQDFRREERDAVMLGFLEGARDSGLMDDAEYCSEGVLHKVAYVAITPDALAAPVHTTAGVSSGIARTVGSMGSHVFGGDETDEKIQQMNLEQRKLDAQAQRIMAQRRNRLLKRVLARRQQQLTGSQLR